MFVAQALMPERCSMPSKAGTERKNSSYSSSVQKTITRSTPARLYQLRSNSTISPAAGRWAAWRWNYHCVRSLRNRGLAGLLSSRPDGIVKAAFDAGVAAAAPLATHAQTLMLIA